MMNIPYVTEEVVIEPQTTVFLYTDGLNEAMDADGNLFGDDRIIDEMSHAIQDGQLSPKAVIDRTIQAVHQFVGDYEQSDDLTMLAFKHTINP
jgi:sigma-B regulation protein RsbU (phosphoserine phosphatase)